MPKINNAIYDVKCANKALARSNKNIVKLLQNEENTRKAAVSAIKNYNENASSKTLERAASCASNKYKYAVTQLETATIIHLKNVKDAKLASEKLTKLEMELSSPRLSILNILFGCFVPKSVYENNVQYPFKLVPEDEQLANAIVEQAINAVKLETEEQLREQQLYDNLVKRLAALKTSSKT